MLFDDSGTKFTYLENGVGSDWQPAESIFSWLGGILAFNDRGVGASKLYANKNGRLFYAIFDYPGNEFLYYSAAPNQDPYFTPEQPVNLLHGALTYNVGASFRMALGVDVYDCYFDKNAAKYIVVGDSNGLGSSAFRTINY